MKGLVVTKDNKLYLEENLPIPEIGDYEALVKNECCMICNGTDLGVIGGQVREVTRYPAVLGHEDAGRVVKIGKKVTSFKVGDLVVRAGQPDNDKFSSAWGGFAEYGIVKDYKAAMEDQADVKDINLGITQQVCPEGMQAEAASMLITLKETYSALKRIGVEDKKKMVILGDGPVALAFLSCAKLMGIQEIYVLGNHRDKLETAEKMGVAGIFLNKDEKEKKKASDLFNRKIDICIDTIGSNQTITQCLDYIKETGTIAVYGLKSGENLDVPLPELRNFNIQYIQWPVPEVEAEVHKPVCDAIMDGKIDIDLFVTHRFSIDDYEKGFQAVKDRTALKVVLNF